MRRGAILLGAVLTVMGLWAMGFVPLAHAHAFPDHSDPRVGSTVKAAPPQVRIWFDGRLEPAFSSMDVRDASGKRVDKGEGEVDPKDPTLLKIDLLPLSPGSYRVYWSVVAVDGHQTEGDFSFTIGVSP